MKNRYSLLMLSALASITFFSSCKKEDSKSKTELITAASWKMKSFVIISGSTRVDTYLSMEACEKDNTFSFKTDNTVVYDEGATKCNEEDDQTDAGTWSFTENEKKLVLDGETAEILSLTGSELKVSTSYTQDNITITNEITLVH